MDLAFCSFSSGITGSKIMENLKLFGLSPSKIHGLVLSHEHFDHVKGLSRMTIKTIHAEYCATEGTLGAIGDRLRRIPVEQQRVVHSGDDFSIGDIDIHVFALSHDAAEPVGTASKGTEKRLL